jgi:ribose transport system permease protein
MKKAAVSVFLLKNTSLALFVLLFCVFGTVSPRFFSATNMLNILTSASYIGIIAVGMTFVLLTGGIDLSVGSNMYLSGIVAGLLIGGTHAPVWAALPVCIAAGMGIGAVNALFIVKVGVIPFVTTLSMMIVARGTGLLLTRSVAVNFPESVTMMGTLHVAGFIPLPVVIFACVVAAAYVLLEWTPFGRQIYAVGNDPSAATKAGIHTAPVLISAYVICGAFAALGGFISVAQLGIINAGFGRGDEFDAIASAVLGGTSLFGGIGSVFPGTVLGTIMIQMIQAGLVFSTIDLYIQPMVMAGIIFVTVFLDSFRTGQLRKMQRRHILKRE